MVKNPPANAGDAGFSPGSERSPGVGNGNSLQYSSLEKVHGQRSLVGCTLGSQRVGMTEYTHTTFRIE